MNGERVHIQVLASAAILLSVLGGAGVWWSQHRAAMVLGPYAICADDHYLWMATGEQLIRAKRNGDDATVLQTSLPISSIADLAVHPDGRLLVADVGSGTVLAMDPFGGDAVPLIDRGYHGPLDLAVVDERIFVAVNKEHRIDVFDRSGRFLYEGPNDLHRYPNDLFPTEEGNLWVADTNRFRLALISGAEEDFGRMIRQIDVEGIVFGRRYPLAVTGDGKGNLWTIVANNSLVKGEVVEIDPQSREETVHPFPGRDPKALFALDDRLLIADPESLSLELVDDGALVPFGGKALREITTDAENRRRRYRSFLVIAATVLGIALLLASAVVVMDSRTEPRRTPRAMPGDVLELKPRPAHITILVSVGLGITIAIIAFLVFLAFLGSEPRLLIIWAGLVPIGPIFAYIGLAVGKTRVGRDGDRLLLVDHRGQYFRLAPEKVSFSERALVADGVAVVTQMGVLPLFDTGAMVKEIHPLLQRARPIGQWQTEMALLRTGHPTWLMPLLILVPIALGLGVWSIAFW